MNDWTCPYCRAYNSTGRCVKCGAFFEDKFDDIVEKEESFEEMVDTIFEEKSSVEPKAKSFETVYEQAATQQLEVVKKLHGDAHKKKHKTTVRFPVKPFILGIVMIMLVFSLAQPYTFGGEPYDGGDNPTEPLFQLDILVLWENNSKYDGLVEIWDRWGRMEKFSTLNGRYDSEFLYDTWSDLTFKVFNADMGLPLSVYTLSLVDMQDWTPGVYFGYPVVIKLPDDWR